MPSWRNWISRLTSNQKSVGSSPTGGNKMFFLFFSDYYYLDLLDRTEVFFVMNIFYILYDTITSLYRRCFVISEEKGDVYYSM